MASFSPLFKIFYFSKKYLLANICRVFIIISEDPITDKFKKEPLDILEIMFVFYQLQKTTILSPYNRKMIIYENKKENHVQKKYNEN